MSLDLGAVETAALQHCHNNNNKVKERALVALLLLENRIGSDRPIVSVR